MLVRTLLAAAAGVVLTTAFAPWSVTLVVPGCLAVLLLCVRGLRARSAWLPGLAFGLGFMAVLQWWMKASVGPDAWVGISLLEAAFFAPLGSGLALVSRWRAWPVLSAVLWVAVETWRSGWPFGGMPWGRLSYAVVDTPLESLLPYVGFTGVSLLLALLGGGLAWLVSGGWRSPVLAAGGLAAAVLAMAAPAVVPYDPGHDGSAEVAVVQGNVPGDGSDILLDHRQVTRNHVDATVEHAARVRAGEAPRPDLVVWPENSTAVDPFDDAGINAGIWEASDAVGVPLLVGAIADAEDPTALLNQGIVWNPGTGAGDRYTKRHPVPFGEYVPWRGLGLGTFGSLAIITRDMGSGTRAEPLRVGELQVADAICFDVAYDDALHEQLAHGADIVVVQTSNAMFIHTEQIHQQFEITRLRALETGRSVAVASTNGITALIRPDGSVVDTAEPRTQDVLTAELALSDSVTPAVRMGPWPGRVAIGVALLAVVVALRPVPYRRSRATEDGPASGSVRDLVGASASEGTS